MNIFGLDLAPRKCGWCAGDGSVIPTAGGFRLPGVQSTFGELLELLRIEIDPLLVRFDPDVVMIEEAILPTGGFRGDGRAAMGTTEQRRIQMAQGPFVEWLALKHADRRGRPIIIEEASPFDVKYALTGNKKADKDTDMVPAAERLGIVLPKLKVEGREDAADAAGAWLVGVRLYAKEYLAAWDRRVFAPRGALL